MTPLRNHATKIVATIGPASSAPATMEAMIRAGQDVARLNFSHGTFDDHGRDIRNLRAAAAAAERDLAILVDLPGPKIRLGRIAGEPIELQAGASFVLTTDEIEGDATRAFVSFARLPQVAGPGDHLFVNDGIVDLQVESIRGCEVHCRVVVGGEIRSRKGVNLPGVDLGISAFTEHDRRCLEFALGEGIDIVSQSFVESGADIEAVRAAGRAIGHEPFVVAKIERARALDRIDEILAAADGIMIARGDLGVEVPVEQIAILQKGLMRKAIRAGKPVITATQMLESMTHSRRPTRAESTDVANAILDGTDAVMLSAESASGRFPVEAVATLARIAAVTEPHRPRYDLWERLKNRPQDLHPDAYDLVALAAEAITELGEVAAVFVPTGTGRMARSIARFRLPIPIAVTTADVRVARRLLLSYGVWPEVVAAPVANWNEFARDWLREHDLRGERALLLRGPSPDEPATNHSLELIDLAAN
ncbi:MAG: pyruvate kinase [Candidatus Binatia bacterium]